MVDQSHPDPVDAALAQARACGAFDDDARAALERALPLASGDRLTELLRRLTACCDALGDPVGAIEFARRTLMRAPGDHEALHALTLNLFRQHSEVRAWQWLSELRRHHPDELGIYWDMLRLFQIQDRAADAITLARELEVAYPENAEVAGMAASVYHAAGSSDEAWASAERALDRDPESRIAHEAMASVLLSQGRLREGYQHVLRLDALDATAPFEDDSARGGDASACAPGRPWRGESLSGERLLVVADGSLRRNLLLGRYLRWAREQAQTVGFAGPPALRPVFTRQSEIAWVDEPSDFGASLRCSMTTLAAEYHQQESTIPALDSPFGVHDAGGGAEVIEPERWRSRVDVEGLRIGICWKARSSGRLDVTGNRCNIPVDRLRPLFGRLGTHFYSLSSDPGAYHADFAAHTRCHDFGDELKDLRDAAALMQCLDLIISVDSSVAHLAGNLELPVWVLLANRPDPLWGPDGGHCSWYPTARVFRQRQRGDWDRVVRHVGVELDALLRSRV